MKKLKTVNEYYIRELFGYIIFSIQFIIKWQICRHQWREK